MRVYIPLASVLYMFFVLWDVAQQDNSGLIQSASIRLGFVFVSSACYYMLFQQPLFPWTQEILFIMSSGASLGVVAILFLFEDGFMIGVGGIMLCVMFGCTIGMLRVKYSSLFCAFSIFATNVAVLFDDSSYDLWYVPVNTNFFLVTLCLFGIMFSYIAELHFRQRFLDTDTIFRWNNPSTNVH